MKTSSTLFRTLRLICHLDWIRYGIRDRILRLFVNPDTTNSYEFETDYFGMTYKGNLNSYIDWCVYFYGAYEKQLLLLARDLLQNRIDPIFIDIGANVGTYSLFLSKFCKEVYAFEPCDNMLNIFRQNIKINNIQNIFVYNVALGERNCKMDLSVPKRGNLGSSSFVWRYGDKERMTLSNIDVVTGDEVIKKINPEKIDLIKIDVEGFEKNVLIGLRKSLKAFYPIILIELSRGIFSNINEFDTALDGYEVYKVSYNTHRFVFFNTPSCCLSKFDFNSLKGQEDILCLPKNSLSLIKSSGMPTLS